LPILGRLYIDVEHIRDKIQALPFLLEPYEVQDIADLFLKHGDSEEN
jgi:type II secretory pathway component PulL